MTQQWAVCPPVWRDLRVPPLWSFFFRCLPDVSNDLINLECWCANKCERLTSVWRCCLDAHCERSSDLWSLRRNASQCSCNMCRLVCCCGFCVSQFRLVHCTAVLCEYFLIIRRLAQFDVYNFKANGLLHVSTFNFSGNPHDCGAAVSLSVYVRGRDVHAVHVGSVGSSVVWTWRWCTGKLDALDSYSVRCCVD